MRYLVFVLLFSFVAGCANQASLTYIGDENADGQTASELFASLPAWQVPGFAVQINGSNTYPQQGALAKLLADADSAFLQRRYADCRSYLERAQRIAPREVSVYVRLSYLALLFSQKSQAQQLALRALALSGSDEQVRSEVNKLIGASR